MKESTRSILLLSLFFCMLALVETTWLHSLRSLDNQLSDWFVRHHAETVECDSEIVIINIDNASVGRMTDVAGSWPWPRSVHGELVRGIARQHPRAIVFDIAFDTPDVYRSESDKLFNDALADQDHIFFPLELRPDLDHEEGVPVISKQAGVLGFIATQQANPDAPLAVVPPLAIDKQHWRRTGTIKFENDDDGVGRRYRVFNFAHGWLIPSLPARVAQSLGYSVPQTPDMILSWASKTSFRRISYVDLYQDFDRERPQRAQDELTDKIVVIAADASGMNDMRVTPLASLYPGAGILATAIANLKNQSMMQPAAPWFPFTLALALLALTGQAFVRSINVLKTGLTLFLLTLVVLGASYWAVVQHVLAPVLTPLAMTWAYYFACALREYRHEKAAREKAVQMFSRFVNPHVVRELVAHGGISRAGESRQITVLFSDIRGFTTLCENRAPQEVVELLNRYFALQVEVVFRHGGSLDKFIGDGLMAFWGAPLDDPQHALHAVTAALEMVEVLQHFKNDLGALDCDFEIGIGIHSGAAVVGLIGSEQRREYTAIGDTVNLASRIEGLTKGVSRVLVSGETMALCRGAIDFASMGSHTVKGREQKVELFAPGAQAVLGRVSMKGEGV